MQLLADRQATSLSPTWRGSVLATRHDEPFQRWMRFDAVASFWFSSAKHPFAAQHEIETSLLVPILLTREGVLSRVQERPFQRSAAVLYGNAAVPPTAIHPFAAQQDTENKFGLFGIACRVHPEAAAEAGSALTPTMATVTATLAILFATRRRTPRRARARVFILGKVVPKATPGQHLETRRPRPAMVTTLCVFDSAPLLISPTVTNNATS